MKTIIVYGTKYGTAEKCSKLLKAKLQGEVTLVNIKKESLPDITAFDNIIIGGSIYMGQIRKEVKKFCTENLNVLKDKRVGLFICGLSNEDVITPFKNSFPEVLLNNAIAKEHFGGEVVFKRMNFLEGFIMKKVAKTDKDVSKLSEENINKFAESVNKI